MKALLVAGLAALALIPARSPAAPWDDEGFRDPVDGRFDASHWLLERKGFLPVPIVITEPAIGYGGGIGLLFFHRNLAAPGEAGKEGRAFVPPDITAAFAMGTENGTRGGGFGHLGYSEGRRWRYFAGAARGSINLAWYGSAGFGGGTQSEGRDFNIDGTGGVADLRYRFGDSEWWAGLRYLGSTTKSSFDRERPAEIPPWQYDATISGLGPVVEYDGRDTIFTPSRGVRFYGEALRFLPSLGSDHSFDRWRLALQGFHPLGGRFVLGLRADAQGTSGEPPFYARPFIELRGIPAMRYQGDRVAVLEAEGRFDLDGRWSLVGFAGAGRAAASGGLADAPTRSAFGGGVRYFIARALGLHVGMDVARGPEKSAVYLIVGSMWR